MDFIKEFDTAINLWGNGDIIKSISERPEEDVFDFAEIMSLISKHHFTPHKNTNENFSFIANSSLSGGSHPCSEPDCRIQKIDNPAHLQLYMPTKFTFKTPSKI